MPDPDQPPLTDEDDPARQHFRRRDPIPMTNDEMLSDAEMARWLAAMRRLAYEARRISGQRWRWCERRARP